MKNIEIKSRRTYNRRNEKHSVLCVYRLDRSRRLSKYLVYFESTGQDEVIHSKSERKKQIYINYDAFRSQTGIHVKRKNNFIYKDTTLCRHSKIFDRMCTSAVHFGKSFFLLVSFSIIHNYVVLCPRGGGRGFKRKSSVFVNSIQRLI